jgi:hypothetical protein
VSYGGYTWGGDTWGGFGASFAPGGGGPAYGRWQDDAYIDMPADRSWGGTPVKYLQRSASQMQRFLGGAAPIRQPTMLTQTLGATPTYGGQAPMGALRPQAY